MKKTITDSIFDKKRGKLLTIFIFISAIWIVLWVIDLFSGNYYQTAMQEFDYVPGWYVYDVIISIVINTIILIGLWRWEKWAVYLYFLIILVSYLMYIFIYKITDPWFTTFYILIFSVISFLIIYRKWKYFK